MRALCIAGIPIIFRGTDPFKQCSPFFVHTAHSRLFTVQLIVDQRKVIEKAGIKKKYYIGREVKKRLQVYFSFPSALAHVNDAAFIRSLRLLHNDFFAGLLRAYARHNRKEAQEAIETLRRAGSSSAHGKQDDLLRQLHCIRSLFDARNRDVFEGIFSRFINRYLPLYIAVAGPTASNEIARCLDSARGASQLIMGRWGMAVYNAKTRSGMIIYERTRQDTQPDMLRILRVFYKLILNCHRQGIILHASSIEYNDKGFIFIGKSGAGKSTVVDLLKTQRVLSDETAVIRKTKGSYRIFPNPWWNAGKGYPSSSSQKPAPLSAIFFLKKAATTSLRALCYQESLQQLLRADYPFHQCDTIDNTVGGKNFYLFVCELMKRVPVFEISVHKGEDFKRDFETLRKKYFAMR